MNRTGLGMVVSGVALLLASVGCDGGVEEFPVLGCESGQCDLFDDLQDLRDDARKLKLDDLFLIAGGLFTEALNDTIENDYFELEVGKPAVFALHEEADGHPTLGSIDSLVDGLARRYGERGLTLEANRLRRDHLVTSEADYYAEASFRLGPELTPGWNWAVDAGGLDDASVRVGFRYENIVEARVVAAIDDKLDAIREAPLKAIRATRKNLSTLTGKGFILPESTDHILDMAPGDLLALSSAGTIATNFGAGIPIFVADPGSISYRIVLSAALRTRIRGERMDVQLLRVGGDDVVLDVGVSDVTGIDGALAIRDGWGVHGLLTSRCEEEDDDCQNRFSVDVGPVKDVRVDKLVDESLQGQLNKLFSLFGFDTGGKYAGARLSIARFRFTLTRGDTKGDVAKALTLAFKGDLRAAQRLANEGNPAVVTEFDLAHGGRIRGLRAGFDSDFLGMGFFIGKEWTETETTIQTPGGIMALLMETLHIKSRWLFDTHALITSAIAGLTVDAKSPDQARGESNMVIQLAEGDEFMEADKHLDHFDALIQSLVGWKALRALEDQANAMQRTIEDECPAVSPFDECRIDMQTSDKTNGFRERALADFKSELGDLDGPRRELVDFLADKRLDVQAVRQYPAQWTGPTASMTLSLRLDDTTIENLATVSPYDFVDAVTDYLTVVEIERNAPPQEILNERLRIVDRVNAEDLIELFTDFSNAYRPMVGAEETVLKGLGRVGPRALEIRFDVDSDDHPKYSKAVAQSIAKRRTQLVSDFFHDLSEEAEGHRGAHVALYTLLSLIPDGHLDLRVDYDVDTSDGFSSVNEPYREAGYENFDLHCKEAPDPIKSEVFDVETFAKID